MKIQPMQKLRKEMRAVARGEQKATADTAQPSFESVETVTHLLLPENRHLLSTIEKSKPESILKFAGILSKKGHKPLPIELLSR